MTQKSGSILPIVLAVACTVALGAYFKSRGEESSDSETPRPSRPKSYSVKMVRQGTGFNEHILPSVWGDPPAAWVEFQVYESGVLKPSAGGDRLNFVAKDAVGRTWPLNVSRFASGKSYAIVPGGHPIAAEGLNVECFDSGKSLAKWSITNVEEPRRRLHKSQVAADLPKISLTLGDLGSKEVSLSFESTSKEPGPLLVGHSYGVSLGGRNLATQLSSYATVPRMFLEHLDLLEVRVQKRYPLPLLRMREFISRYSVVDTQGKRLVQLPNTLEVRLSTRTAVLLTPSIENGSPGFYVGISGSMWHSLEDKFVTYNAVGVSSPGLRRAPSQRIFYTIDATAIDPSKPLEIDLAIERTEVRNYNHIVPFSALDIKRVAQPAALSGDLAPVAPATQARIRR